MPHCGIQVRISTSCSPAMPSWNPLTMPSEATNVASEASSPMPLIAPVAFLGKKTSRIAAAIGNQRVTDRTFIGNHRRGARQRARNSSARRELRTRCRAPLREYPYEDDDPHEEHQRVIAHVTGLEEAQQVAG